MTEMSPAEEIFFKALEKPASDRLAYLSEACAGNPELLARLQNLLAAQPKVGEFLELKSDDQATRGFEDRDAGSTAAHVPTPDQGTIIAGKYKLLQQIGEGGMGTVWMADQTEPVKRRVAVKLIRVERGSSATILARFEAERQAIALMDHPHIAKLLDAGTTDTGSPFFVMELVKGVPLNEYCDTHKLSIPERLNLFMQICSAVQHAHQKGIIHRDLKPSNILVESHDGKPVPKVIDFGLAKATSGLQLTENTLFTGFGTVMGTPLYMAPEQATFNAVDVDTRADIYALGVILYELLTGTTPLTKETIKKAAIDEMLKLIREQEAPTPSSRLSSSDSLPSISANRQTEPQKLGRFVKGELDWIVMKALSKERDRRYETANGFAKDIERFLNHEPVQAGPVTAAYRIKKFVRRNRGQVIAASLVLFALLAGIAGTTVGLIRANQAIAAERMAQEEAQHQAQRAMLASEEERKARLDAQEKQKLAVAAAEAEKVAKLDVDAKRQEAERNLAFAKKGNEILGSVFAGLDPTKIAESGRPLQDVLRENLVKAVEELDGSAIGDPLEVAAMQNTLGKSLLGLGEYGLAIKVFTKARDTRKAKLGLDHPKTLLSMSNLAVAYHEAKMWDLALPLMEETVKLQKAKLGPDHPETLFTMNILASAYWPSGKRRLDLPLFEENLKLVKAKLGPDHPNTLSSMSNLATAYLKTGKQDLALPLIEETLRLQKTKLGPDHPNTLSSMGNLARVYQNTGKPDLALPLLEESFKIQKAKLGPDHPNTQVTMSNLAMAYQHAGKRGLDLPLLEETLKLQKAKLGPDHPRTITSMTYLALSYNSAGKPDLALQLREEIVKLQKAKLGPDHPDTLFSKAMLALSYLNTGKPDLALPYYEENLRIQKAKHGLDHPNTLNSMRTLGIVYRVAKHGVKAAELLMAYIAAKRKQSKPDDPQFAEELAQVSLELLMCDQFSTAEEMLRECLAIRDKFEPNDWRTFNTQSLLGGALLGQKKYAEAEPLLLKGYEGMKAREKTIPPQGSTRISEALDRLIELYTATNKPDEVKKYRELRAKYPSPKEVAPLPRVVK